LWQLSSDGRDVNHLIAYAYDAVMVYLHAIDFLLKNKLVVLGQIRRQVCFPSCSLNLAMLASSHPTPHSPLPQRSWLSSIVAVNLSVHDDMRCR